MKKIISLLLVLTMLVSASSICFAGNKHDPNSNIKTIHVASTKDAFESASDETVVLIYDGIEIKKSDIVDGEFTIETPEVVIETIPDLYHLPSWTTNATVIKTLTAQQYFQETTYAYLDEDEAEVVSDDLRFDLTTSLIWAAASYYINPFSLPVISLICIFDTWMDNELADEIDSKNGPVIVRTIDSTYLTVHDVFSWDSIYVDLSTTEYQGATEVLSSFGYDD